MRNFTFFILLFLMASDLFAQSSDAVSYQALIRNDAGQLVASKAIGVQITILQGDPEGFISYQETHAVTTNANGLISIAIGTGSVKAGAYAAIDWSVQPYYLRTSLDLSASGNYTEYSTTQLKSVPYALKAKKADTFSAAPVTSGGGLSVASNKISITNGVNADNLKIWDGTAWVNKSISVQTELTGEGQPVVSRSPYLSLTYQIALQGSYPSKNGYDTFVGEIMLFASPFEVRNYAFCNGQLLSKATNEALFSLLGTTYGGDGETTFGLPDLQGRAPVHFGTAPGMSTVALGQSGGADHFSLTPDNLPSHQHTTTVTFAAP